jgi:DNA polymerase (family 10)
MTKNEIADILEQIGTLLELKGENPFKIRAYASGARALEAIEESELDRLIAEESLQSVKGIGEALAQKITELRTTGKLAFFEKLQASIEPGLVELLQIPGLGPKKIRALHSQLGIASIAALSEACRAGRVAELAGFGEKTQQKLLEGIANREAYGRRHLWWDAYEVAAQILPGSAGSPGRGARGACRQPAARFGNGRRSGFYCRRAPGGAGGRLVLCATRRERSDSPW